MKSWSSGNGNLSSIMKSEKHKKHEYELATTKEKRANEFEALKENYLETRQKEFKQALNNRIAISTINISLGYVSKGISYSSYVLFKKLISSNPYTSSYVMFTIKYLPFYYRPFFFFCKCNSSGVKES